MARPISVVLGDYPHTRLIKSRTELASARVSFPEITPVHGAFHAMVRDQRYDVCELALATFLQAREAGKPLLLLPVVTVGGFHHANILRSPAAGSPREPKELAGRRVGVRAYTTTMGLWARSVLEDEYGVVAADVTWVTTEEPHVAEYREPANVVRADGSLRDLLLAGELAAAIMNAGENPDLEPMIPTPANASLRWYQRHRTVPVNHMVAVTRTLLDAAPDVVAAVYGALAAGLADTARPPASDGLPPAVRFGREAVRGAIELAATAARRQGLTARDPGDIDDLFAL
jgi:4,5-dihydroxyphthalate decarboxylase